MRKAVFLIVCFIAFQIYQEFAFASGSGDPAMRNPRVSNVQIEKFNSTQLRISWNAMPNIIHYTIYGSDTPLPADSPEWQHVGVTSNLYYDVISDPIRKFYYITADLDPFVLVPGGNFNMGSTMAGGHWWELPIHQVTLSPFYIGTFEVTQSEWQAVMGTNPAHDYGVGDDYPVYLVSWYDILKYCNLRSMNEGLTPVYTISASTTPASCGAVPTYYDTAWDAVFCNWSANGYRLPTEAECEYASRGANNIPDYLYSGSDDIDAVAWYNSNSGGTTHPVGTKAPNGLGIYDLSGNVMEWCWDFFRDNYYSVSPENNPTGPAFVCDARTIRSGSWFDIPLDCRVSTRYAIPQFAQDGAYGFRLVKLQE